MWDGIPLSSARKVCEPPVRRPHSRNAWGRARKIGEETRKTRQRGGGKTFAYAGCHQLVGKHARCRRRARLCAMRSLASWAIAMHSVKLAARSRAARVRRALRQNSARRGLASIHRLSRNLFPCRNRFMGGAIYAAVGIRSDGALRGKCGRLIFAPQDLGRDVWAPRYRCVQWRSAYRGHDSQNSRAVAKLACKREGGARTARPKS